MQETLSVSSAPNRLILFLKVNYKFLSLFRAERAARGGEAKRIYFFILQRAAKNGQCQCLDKAAEKSVSFF